MVIEKDAAGRIVSAFVPSPFIIDQLLEHEVIDREQHGYEIHFVAMRKVFLRGVATYKTVALYQSPDNEPITPPRFLCEMKSSRDSLTEIHYIKIFLAKSSSIH